MPASLPNRPIDATLSVTKAARLLGVHPNTVRAWSDAGRLRYYRINPRGDRRYRLGDLQRFLAAAAGGHGPEHGPGPATLPPAARRDHIRAAMAQAALSPAPLPAAGEPESEAAPRVDLTVALGLARLPGSSGTVDRALHEAVAILRDATGNQLVAAWELDGHQLVPRAAAGSHAGRLVALPPDSGILGRALARGSQAAPIGAPLDRVARSDDPAARRGDPAPAPIVAEAPVELAIAIPGPAGPWGVLHVAGDAFSMRDVELTALAGEAIGAAIAANRRTDEVAGHLHRAEALRRVASDIGSRLELDRILSGLADHAMVLFEADRAAVFLRHRGGQALAEVSRGLSSAYLGSVRELPPRSIQAAAIAARQPVAAVRYADDPRGADVRAAVVQEGIDTVCSAPLFDGEQLLGMLDVYHDQPHAWNDMELETMASLATQAAVAIRTAQNYEQMATWAAQLQSIQQLGARLNRLSNVKEIGLAIAKELRQLIDYHNVRVYRLTGDDLLPVAMSGQVGEYVDETAEQLGVKLGQGITGWVAEHRIAQNLPDAAKDPRANTIPGTEDDLDESMLLAPMVFEDQVLGVLVLAKLGLHQFTDDDLRLLVIYASLAAQAMANADATEKLRAQSAAYERQVRSQRALLQITESMLATFDARAVLDSITERLGGLIACDNIAIEVLDPASGLLTPLTARGIHAEYYLEPWEPGETGVAPWVVEHNEAVYIADERSDPRVNAFRDADSMEGCLIVVPLRGRDGAIGVLTLERLGVGAEFATDEFELVQLFAAQVSIALQNAEVYRAIEIRARTDDLTGLYNHGTFQEWLGRHVGEGTRFSLVMVDLDDFRSVNNTLGHQAGDELLRAIAIALRAAGRTKDLTFRYGGDEFALILPDTDPAGAHRVAERVHEAVEEIGGPGSRWAADGATVTASVGISTFPDDGSTAAAVLLAADRAAFVAKRGGRNQIATAEDGLALAAEFSLQEPTPVDPPSPAEPAGPHTSGPSSAPERPGDGRR
jgi:diguanylate cyclase (GGDEF)-like protein/excisionase family DNA binding protein